MPPVVDQREQARRLRAAVAYSGRTEPEIARAAAVTLRTLGRWKQLGFPRNGDPRDIRAISRACNIPYAWFTADFGQLWRIPYSPEDGFSGAAGSAEEPPSAPSW